jgi:hypothetical protein
MADPTLLHTYIKSFPVKDILNIEFYASLRVLELTVVDQETRAYYTQWALDHAGEPNELPLVVPPPSHQPSRRIMWNVFHPALVHNGPMSF